MRILLLDDSVDNLNLLKLYAKKSSDEFVMVSDVEDAMTKIEEEDFDMFFLDIQMPHKDGYEVLENVRASEKGKDLFVCALTAYTSQAEIEKIEKSSFNDYLKKPILRSDFLEYIDNFSIKAAG